MTLAGWQWWRAERQRQMALSRQLAAQALHLKESRFDLSLLLSVAATKIAATPEARSSLLAMVLHEPHLASFLPGPSMFRGDGGLQSGWPFPGFCRLGWTIRLWDVASRKPYGKPLTSPSRSE